MQPINTQVSRYDFLTILFHWLVALLVLEQFIGGLTIDLFPRGPMRANAISVHILLGGTLAALVLLRILWRFTLGRQLPTEPGFLNKIAKGVHHLLYLLLVVLVLVGLVLTSARGDAVFDWFKIWSFAPGNRDLAHQIAEIHELLGYLIIGVVALHALGALFHRIVLKDRIYYRMTFRA
ncbi:MAG: cytochrome b/b6 domain-containing protein [Acetobacteraceae bacterium]|nr:cytochrome b [Pseudomonadota bacterium]